MINTQELLFTLERPVTLRACLSRKSTIARGTSYWRRIQTFRQGGGGVGGWSQKIFWGPSGLSLV